MARGRRSAVPEELSTLTIEPEIVQEASIPELPPAPGIRLVSTCLLLAPVTNQTFRPNTPVVVPEVTGWMQAQIQAGLLKKM